MSMKFGLFQQQSLKLVMTKELSQAITLLQYSSLELETFLQEQSLDNPLIELKEPKFDTYRKQKDNPIDYIGKNSISLYQHLESQISFMDLSTVEKAIVNYVIHLLDENGYLHFSSEVIANQLSTDINTAEKAIRLIQSLEPVGVGSRNLQECLLLQLKARSTRNLLAETIVSDYFKLFADKSWKKISRQLEIKISDIQEVFDLVQTLHPRPGSDYTAENTGYIVPDIEIIVEHGGILLKINDEYLPQVSLNLQYYNLLTDKDEDAKSYLQEKVDQCQWIMKSIDQRKQTLRAVMEEIVVRQRDFFLHGPVYMKSLTMNEVAEALEIHESTVSRATKGKYVQTPFGIYEMKYFFSRNIQTTGDSDTSAIHVKNVLTKLIEFENKKKPMSDQLIVETLEKEHGIIVSRRTIAKYRDQLNIPSSSKRKRYE